MEKARETERERVLEMKETLCPLTNHKGQSLYFWGTRGMKREKRRDNWKIQAFTERNRTKETAKQKNWGLIACVILTLLGAPMVELTIIQLTSIINILATIPHLLQWSRILQRCSPLVPQWWHWQKLSILHLHSKAACNSELLGKTLPLARFLFPVWKY